MRPARSWKRRAQARVSGDWFQYQLSVRYSPWVAYGFIGLIIIEVIFSWVNPNAPLAPLVRGMTDPLLSPFRRVLPAIAGVDLSPVLAFLALRILVFVAETLVYSAY